MNINENSVISWDPVGTSKYTVRIETATGGVLSSVANIVGTSIPAADLILNTDGTPKAGITTGVVLRVQSQGAFGNSPGATLAVTVGGAPADPTGLTIT